MATISKRKAKDGSLRYTAQIRMMRDGITHSEAKTDSDLKFLKLWVLKRESELSEPGAISAMKNAKITIGDVLRWYREDFQGSTKFGRTKLAHIDFLIGNQSLSDLDAINLKSSQLIKYGYERQQTSVSPSTINNDFVWLRNAMRDVRLSRDIDLCLQAVDDAAHLLRRQRVIGRSKQRDRRPSIDELDQLMAYFLDRDTRSSIKMSDIVLFALFSTRRQEEICNICWGDLDERRRGVLVRLMKHPREKRDTFVFLPDEAWAVIKRQPKTDERIFPFKSKTISANFTRACSFLMIKDLRFHDLRHEGISWLFELGLDIPRVSGISGHKSWSSLQRYTHIAESDSYDKYKHWPHRPV